MVSQFEDYNKGLIYTNIKGCIDCNKCLHACPILKSNVSVMDNDGSYKMCVDEKECVLCGACIDTCVHGVRQFEDDCDAFFLDLKQGRSVSVLVAPAFYTNYPDECKNIMGYLKSLGVKNFYPVSFGADIATWGYLNYITNNNVVGNVAQPCPSIVYHIEKHQPELLPSLIPIQSPMMCTAIYLKRYKGIQEDLAFLSPCIAKKAEIRSKRGLGLIRHNVTFKNLLEHIKNQEVNLKDYPSVEEEGSSGLGSLFPMPGGLKENVEYYLGSGSPIIQAEGEQKAYKYLKTLAARINKKKDFIPLLVDIMNCEMGCCYGTGTEFRLSEDDDIACRAVAMRKEKYNTMKEQSPKNILGAPARFAHMNEVFRELNLEDFMCEYTNYSLRHTRVVSEAEIQAIFEERLMKLTDNDKHVDCSACGYKSCRHMAEAIAYGINHHDNCVFYVQWSKMEAESASKAKSDFLSKMSHEIRTPLTAVLGISEIQLHNPALPLEIEEAFAKIYNSSSKLLGIVNDILDMSKVEAGKMEIVNAKFEVSSVLSDIVQLNLAYLGSKRLNFNIDVDENIPAFLVGDELRIKQILNNILSNAFKYTDEGAVNVKVHIKEGPSNDYVNLIVVVQDTGRGMNREQLKALFDEYSRFHEKEGRFEPGTGLGMPITYALLKMMNGTIEVDSEADKGTTVTIVLPQKIASAQTLGAENARNLKNFNTDAQSAAKRLSFSPEPMPYGRILVVDDVDANIYVATGLMSLYKLQIESCLSGIAAIERVKSGKVYDIIFMDQMMPKMNGTEATAIIRQIGYKQPIVALTADALVGQAEKFLQNGFDGFLSKPIQTVHLNALLHKFVKDKHPEAAAKEMSLNKEANAEERNIDDYFGNFMEISGTNDKVRRDILRNRKNIIREITGTIDANDFKTAHRLAHSLKGLMGIIGEKPLFDLAEKAEMMFRESVVSTELMDALNAEMERVLARIRERLNDLGADEPHAEVILDKDNAKEIFDQLLPLLQANSFDALELCGRLAAIPQTNDLINQIEAVDYALAIKTLATLRENLGL